MSQYNLVHKSVLVAQMMKILDVKAAKGMEKARDDPSIEFGKSRAKRRLYWKHKKAKS